MLYGISVRERRGSTASVTGEEAPEFQADPKLAWASSCLNVCKTARQPEQAELHLYPDEQGFSCAMPLMLMKVIMTKLFLSLEDFRISPSDYMA